MRLIIEPVPVVLADLRVRFRKAGELQTDFARDLDRAIAKAKSTSCEKARKLIGDGPRVKWLDKEVKAAARQCQARLRHLENLAKDPDFPSEASPELASWRAGLNPVVNYLGLWDLTVNVVPFAKIVVRRGDEVAIDDWTPFAVTRLEVAEGYRLELSWPTSENPKKTISLDLKELRHGAGVVVDGDITQGLVSVNQ